MGTKSKIKSSGKAKTHHISVKYDWMALENLIGMVYVK
jgi:hypothetical protein